MSAESPLIRHLRHHLLARRRHRAVLMLVLAGLLACLPLAAALALAAAWLTGVSGPLLALLLMLVPALLLPPLALLLFDLLALLDHQRVRLLDLSAQDDLTRVLNRRHFFDRAEREVGLSLRHGTPLALLLVDIDRLAQINATHGQAAGDRVLQVVAEQCHRPLRQHDLCGRHGGEEFALMLPGTGRDGALTVAERLRRTLPEQRIVLPDGAVVSARVSIGVAVLAPDCASLPQLLARADEALHRAKREGRDRVACAAPVPS
ncbi:MAG: hypothetical protein RL654_1184 [Pseudomonadota bacterium]|jgi:diguanylate cyclase (GGDEF)-like protein